MNNLLLLHGALGSAEQLTTVGESLSAHYYIHKLEFSGHGATAFSGSFSIPKFAHEVLSHLDQNEISTIDILGYSMGGYVALYLAKNFPERTGKIITLATKLSWDEATAAKETAMLNPEKVQAKLPHFAFELQQRHTAIDWREQMKETAALMTSMGLDNPIKLEEYSEIRTPVLLLLGDSDKMVTMAETIAVFKSLPNAFLGILPGTKHPIEAVNLTLLKVMTNQFLLSPAE